ncbi:MAG: 16S rRNA (guanine(966)-N(2))-methyltransferase RsmD [Rickettsiales bacterium]|nr:16S rRNA (guanine(966)-N(2))-methyltransferase RsmD [Rickettsiales bacterium]
MRIISGKHKGRRIELSKEATAVVRPTSDFAREAIFNILAHSDLGTSGHPFVDKDVADIFCGTGALGLEALSRGAKHVTFIDKSRDALTNAHFNAEKMHESDHVDFMHADGTKLPRARRPYAVIFLDPPYFLNLVTPALQSLRDGGWLAPDGIVVVEHGNKEKIAFPTGYTLLDERRYGRAVINVLKLA